MATYADIIDAMVEAHEQGIGTDEIDRLVLSDETMDTFLTDDSFTEEVEERQKDTIGTTWEINVESGDADYLVTDGGTEIFL